MKNLYKKMFAVMNESEAVEKSMTVGSGKNSYKAVSEAAMLNLVKPLFKKHGLIIFPVEGEMQDHTLVWEKTSYNGDKANNLRAMTELKVYYKIVDVESGESETLVGFGNGSDPQDKGAGKAFTYSFKNVLSKTFMLFSGEDTENEHSNDIGKPRQQNKTQNTKVTEIEIKTLRNLLDIIGEGYEQQVLDFNKIKNLEELNKTQYGKAMVAVGKKLNK